MNNPTIKIKLQHHFSSFSLSVDTEIPGSGITALFGHSGSGKTTILRCLAGLEKAHQADIAINGEHWQNAHTFLPPHKRPIGYVFQESSLLPHLTAQGNLNYAIKRAPSPNNQADYNQIIQLMGLQNLLQQYPDSLSGGERQRVAIARALLIQPKLLLMDEPLASLDNAKKKEILPYLEKLKETIKIPVIFISHAIDEVIRLADHIVVMKAGKVNAEGNPCLVLSNMDQSMRQSEDAGVVIESTVYERNKEWHLIKVSLSTETLWMRDEGQKIGQLIRIRIKAKDVSITLDKNDRSSILNKLPATVQEIAPDQDPSMSLVKLRIGNGTILAQITKRSVFCLKLTEGSEVWAQIKSVAVVQ